MAFQPSSIVRFKLDDFTDSLHAFQCVRSDQNIDDHGNAFILRLDSRPRGQSNGGEGDPSLAASIQNVGTNDLHIKFALILRDALGKKFHCYQSDIDYNLKAGATLGRLNFIQKSTILDKKNDILAVDGSLIIDVHIEYKPKKNSLHAPPSSLGNKMLQLLESGDGSDVSFKIGHVIIHAHKLVLKMNSQILFDYCKDSNGESPIQINNFSEEIFNIILRYVYGEEVPDTDAIREVGKEILDAADRFGLVGLKMQVETALVEMLVIDEENVAEWLIFSDAKTCALLKEYALSYFVARSEDILNTNLSDQLKESPKLLLELMRELSKKSIDGVGNGRDVSVDKLRKVLHVRGLDVDGTKEMLVSRLEESKKRQMEDLQESKKRQMEWLQLMRKRQRGTEGGMI